MRKSDIAHWQPEQRWFLKCQTEECYLFMYSAVLYDPNIYSAILTLSL